MLEIHKVYKTCRVTEPARVAFRGVTTETDDELRALAFPAARERESSCFGSSVERYDGGTACVLIYRD